MALRSLSLIYIVGILAGCGAPPLQENVTQPLSGIYADPASGDVRMGRRDGNSEVPDFHFRASADGRVSPKLYVRSIIVGDMGDAPDIGLFRAGPDNADRYTATPQAVSEGTNVGTIYWFSYGGFEPHAHPKDGLLGSGRMAQIYSRARGPQTAKSTPGSFHIATTPDGARTPTDRILVEKNGDLWLWHPTHGRLARVTIAQPDSCGTGLRCLAVEN